MPTPTFNPARPHNQVQDWPDDGSSIDTSALVDLSGNVACIGFWSGSGGTVTVRSVPGNTRTFTVPATCFVPIICGAISTTIADLWPYY